MGKDEGEMTKKMRWIICIVIMICFAGLIFGLYYYFLSRMPNQIHLRADCSQEINFSVPVTGTIAVEAVEVSAMKNSEKKSLQVDFSKPVMITTGCCDTYVAKCKLFGILPYKTIEINVTDEVYMIPSGMTIGIYMQTEGVLVIDTGHFEDAMGNDAAPAESILKPGDYIRRVNGNEVQTKQEFMDYVTACDGNALKLEISRQGELSSASLLPVIDKDGNYKVGIWIRDSTQGIGTVTYVDEYGNFGALGHGVTDADTGELMRLEEGSLYQTEIVSIVKGLHGTPGEITGMIHYVSDNIVGSIEKNDGSGIYGKMQLPVGFEEAALPLAYKGEVHEGEAEIISSVSGEPQHYSIRITGINPASAEHRGLNIQVTDSRLLGLTGGIIQGMSGSPIIQDGKLVGAVTHVLVSDPEKGYGIFIEDMLEASK